MAGAQAAGVWASAEKAEVAAPALLVTMGVTARQAARSRPPILERAVPRATLEAAVRTKKYRRRAGLRLTPEAQGKPARGAAPLRAREEPQVRAANHMAEAAEKSETQAAIAVVQAAKPRPPKQR